MLSPVLMIALRLSCRGLSVLGSGLIISSRIIHNCKNRSSAPRGTERAGAAVVAYCTSASASSSPPLFCNESLPPFDYSEYLLNGCNWREAPTCPDYIGPLFIGRTLDGRGRGLYASHDIPAGNILLISNPFAASFNDPHSMKLYSLICSIAKQYPRALHQLYSLAEYDENIDVPPIQLFDPNSSHAFDETACPLKFDEYGIMNIMNVNCFQGDLRASKDEPAVRLSGLWLLPSFINHSCSPNASRLVVGTTMLILASRRIHANEEITIAYTDCLLPVKMRDEALESLGCGFHCECKRCVFERPLQLQLKDIAERYQLLYDKAVDEVYSIITADGKSASPACLELASIYDSLMKKIKTLETLTVQERHWILSGYSFGFLGQCLVGYSTNMHQLSDFLNPTSLELVEAMRCTAPGMLRTLSFIMILVSIGKRQGVNPALVQQLVQLAQDECIRVYGKQKANVTAKLMEQSLDAIPFF